MGTSYSSKRKVCVGVLVACKQGIKMTSDACCSQGQDAVVVDRDIKGATLDEPLKNAQLQLMVQYACDNDRLCWFSLLKALVLLPQLKKPSKTLHCWCSCGTFFSILIGMFSVLYPYFMHLHYLVGRKLYQAAILMMLRDNDLHKLLYNNTCCTTRD